MIESTKETTLPTEYGIFHIKSYKDEQRREHLAVYVGDVCGEDIPVRIHSECLTGDTLKSLKCDCGMQLELALRYIQEKGVGAVLYLRQEGRGIGLFNKINAYVLQEGGKDTVEANNLLGFPADMRDYRVAAEMLNDLGVRSVVLLTNNQGKIDGLAESGIRVVDRMPLKTEPTEYNRGYLKTKKEKLNHML
ncbi:MAG: GTP cyclohydrolase II [Candidatus Altiarchaeota archaeon]|nr:GTP cyclohydrolase II [Candidatus Altiarchaeota archaeon]